MWAETYCTPTETEHIYSFTKLWTTCEFYHSVAGTMTNKVDFQRPRRQTNQLFTVVRLDKKKKKSKIKALQRLTMDSFRFLNNDKNWNVFRYDTSVIGFSIPVHLPVKLKFLFWFFSSANMNIMLTTVVKTHHLSRVCLWVYVWQYVCQAENN